MELRVGALRGDYAETRQLETGLLSRHVVDQAVPAVIGASCVAGYEALPPAPFTSGGSHTRTLGLRFFAWPFFYCLHTNWKLHLGPLF